MTRTGHVMGQIDAASRGRAIAVLMGTMSLLISTGVLFVVGTDETAIRFSVRVSAGVAAVFFLVPYCASPLWAFSRRPIARSLMVHRRFTGLGFAVAHFVHAATFSFLWLRFPENFLPSIAWTSLIGGTVGYVFLAALTVTSFKGPTAALGRARWRVLHKTGVHVLWALFFLSYVPMLGEMLRSRAEFRVPVVVLTVLYAAAAMLRFAAWQKHRASIGVTSKAAEFN